MTRARRSVLALAVVGGAGAILVLAVRIAGPRGPEPERPPSVGEAPRRGEEDRGPQADGPERGSRWRLTGSPPDGEEDRGEKPLGDEIAETRRDLAIVLAGVPWTNDSRRILDRYRRPRPRVDATPPRMRPSATSALAPGNTRRGPAPELLFWSATMSASPARALELLDRALAQNPGFVPALLLRARAYRVLRRPESARLDLEAALALAPECIPALRMRAELRAEAGDVEGAIAECDRILGIEPSDARALAMRGHLRLGKGDLADAEADLATAAAHVPDDVPLLLALARIRRARGELESAARDAESALALDPGNAEALLERGLVRRSRGDRAGGFRDLFEAGSRARRESDDLFRRAMSAIDERRLGESRKDLERAGSLDLVADQAFAAAIPLAPPHPLGCMGPGR